MPFTEPAFLFYFLPGTLAAYHLAPARLRNLVLTLASFLFYAVGEWAFVGWLLGSTAVTYAVARGIDAWRGQRRAALLLALGLVVDLALLAYFKYAGFAVRTLASLGLTGAAIPEILLPLGISFFTFHKISYKVDVWRGTAEVRKDPLDSAALHPLLPPAHRRSDRPLPRHRRRARVAGRSTLETFASGRPAVRGGLRQEDAGGEHVASVADQVFGIDPAQLGAASAWLGAGLLHPADLLRLLRLLGHGHRPGPDVRLPLPGELRLPLRRPARCSEFWRRWHISLSRWFRDYLYLPLGGNRLSAAADLRQSRRVVFLLCGLWHGASWTFVVWGAVPRAVARRRTRGVGAGAGAAACPPSQHLQTLLWVMRGLGVLPRRRPSATRSAFLRALAGGSSRRGSARRRCRWPRRQWCWRSPRAPSAPPRCWPTSLAAGARRPVTAACRSGRLASGLRDAWGSCSCSAMQVASGSYNPFIYFRF